MGKRDFDYLIQATPRWWGDPREARRCALEPMFFHEFSDFARVVERDGTLLGFLFGLVAAGPPTVGYQHLVAVHPDHRRRGVATVLQQAFEEQCRDLGCQCLKAIVEIEDGPAKGLFEAACFSVEVDPDYAGPARPRLICTKRLSAS